MSTLVEQLCSTPVIEEITPTNEEWSACETVQDRYDLMKRRIHLALARLTPPAEVVRYDLWCNVDGFLEEDKDPEGEWVRYEDHVAGLAKAERQIKGYRWHIDQAEQEAGRALGYPWYKDDQQNFPGATEADGVCIGEHVVDSIVAELARRFKEAEAALGAERAARIEEGERAKEIATGVLVALRQPPADGDENDHLKVMQWERDEIWKACGLDIAKDHHGAVLDWIKAAKERATLSQSNPGDAASPKPGEGV